MIIVPQSLGYWQPYSTPVIPIISILSRCLGCHQALPAEILEWMSGHTPREPCTSTVTSLCRILSLSLSVTLSLSFPFLSPFLCFPLYIYVYLHTFIYTVGFLLHTTLGSLFHWLLTMSEGYLTTTVNTVISFSSSAGCRVELNWRDIHNLLFLKK